MFLFVLLPAPLGGEVLLTSHSSRCRNQAPRPRPLLYLFEFAALLVADVDVDAAGPQQLACE
jgi:hypothetical protein